MNNLLTWHKEIQLRLGKNLLTTPRGVKNEGRFSTKILFHFAWEKNSES